MEKYDSIPSLGEQQRSSYRVFTILVVITQALGVAAAVMVGVWLTVFQKGFSWSDETRVFNFHPLFMIIGMIVCYGHAILVYRIWRNQKKIYTKLMHAGVHALVLIFSGLGLKAVFDSHNLHKPDPLSNVFSLHSWIGLVTIGLFSLQWLLGFLTFLLPYCSQAVRAMVKPIHVYFGVAIFLLAIATCLAGLTEKAFFQKSYPDHTSEGKLINCIGLTLVIIAMITGFLVVNPNYRREPTPEEEEDRQALQLTH